MLPGSAPAAIDEPSADAGGGTSCEVATAGRGRCTASSGLGAVVATGDATVNALTP